MENVFSRRDLFKIFGAMAVAPLLPSFSVQKNNQLGRLLLSTYTENKINGSYFQLLIYDLDQGKIQKIPTPSLQHSFEINPIDPNEVISQVQWGRELCIHDLKSLKIKKILKTQSPKELFVGHGVYTQNGTHFYSSVAQYDKGYERPGKGSLNIYEVKSGKKVGSLSSGGFEPHGTIWLDGEKTLLVLNPGIGPDKEVGENIKRINNLFIPSINILEVNSGKVIKQIDLKPLEISLGHLSVNKKGDLLLIGGKASGNGHWRPKAFKFENDFKLTSLELDEPETSNPLLSPQLDPIGKFASATSPSFNRVYFWDFQTGKLLNKLEINDPLGVTLSLDKSHFVIAGSNKITLLDAANLKVKKTISLGDYSPKGHCLVI
jgi:hypothetical protein